MASRELQLAVELCRLSRRRWRPSVVQMSRLAELRANYDEIAAANPLRGEISRERVEAGGVDAEWLSGPDHRCDCVILYLHGGCYVSGSVETHRELLSRLSLETSMRVLALNYRLAPMHPFPAAVEDTAAAYRWLLRGGIEAARIAIVGDSAGAGLALAAAIKARDEGFPLPGALVCISPWVDLAVTGGSIQSKASEDPIVSREMLLGWGKLYLSGCDPRTPLASPLYADLRALPPLLIQVGSAEVLLDDSNRLAEKASAAGVEATLEVWPQMIHLWHSFAAIMPEGRQAIEGIGKFITAQLARAEGTLRK